ncbi:MAG: Panacea domain-containing protein [Segetibacter sp.]
MSEVLGLGANIYRNYEAGEMPSVATGRLIRMSEDAKEFEKLVQLSKNVFEPGEFEKLQRKLQQSMHGWEAVNEYLESWLFGSKLPDIYNGYRVPNLKKIGNMVKYFSQENKPFTTALNKLMFYADFSHFKNYGYSISGVRYKAIQKGPVPANYGGIYNQLVNEGYVRVEERDFKDFVGEQFFSNGNIDLNEIAVFTETEIDILTKVANRFKNLNTKQIVRSSHDELAWQQNAEEFDLISYVYGFELHVE